jgi:hypothetical protein
LILYNNAELLTSILCDEKNRKKILRKLFALKIFFAVRILNSILKKYTNIYDAAGL